ncbi:MAG: rRNA adenine N-6-methyltransferase family protein [Planctomycetota bacterium]|jgi:16S rRNA G966 N2-methylase RsmD
MDSRAIREKFGDDYVADERTFTMGIDRRFTAHFAERFEGLSVLETCTGAGFTTISLAKTARHVVTVEIDLSIQEQAIANVERAGPLRLVSFVHGDILDKSVLDDLPHVDAAFVDPDWAVTGPEHVFRFMNSNTQPPADTVLNKIFEITENVAIVLPPSIDVQEFDSLPKHERERLYLGENHQLFCLYFRTLINSVGETEFRVPE